MAFTDCDPDDEDTKDNDYDPGDPEDKVLFAGEWLEPNEAALQQRMNDLEDGIVYDD